MGLYAFFYAFLHVINFIIFDASLDWVVIMNSFQKPFVWIGLSCFFDARFYGIDLYQKGI